jgi:tetratricopeptide (TPR) repeat protein
MQGRLRRALGSALLGALTAIAAAGQVRETNVEGQVTTRGPALAGSVSVELISESGGGQYRTFTDRSGAFRINKVPFGRYDLRITSTSGADLYSETVNVRDEPARIDVELPGAISRPRADAGTVSLADMQHKVSPKALKEFRKSEELIAKKRVDEATEHLRKAVDADPAFARAYANLAACEARGNHFEQAAEDARKAVQLDPGLAPAQMNLSHILLILRQYPEAETAARATLKLEGETGQARHFLALALRGQGRFEEALQQFTRAAETVPAARLYAADLLARKGQKDGAAGQLRAYLGSPAAENRAAVEQWLARLGK